MYIYVKINVDITAVVLVGASSREVVYIYVFKLIFPSCELNLQTRPN